MEGLATIVGVTGNAPLTMRLSDLTPHWRSVAVPVPGRPHSDQRPVWTLQSLLAGRSDALPARFQDRRIVPGVHRTDREPSWMPHLRAVGMESDRAYGLAVLRELDAEMTRRSVLFGDAGLTRFADLPATMPLPRILCVIDEFPVLLDGMDKVASQASPCWIRSHGRLRVRHPSDPG